MKVLIGGVKAKILIDKIESWHKRNSRIAFEEMVGVFAETTEGELTKQLKI